jgi:lysophospholipase L1-like esterase
MNSDGSGQTSLHVPSANTLNPYDSTETAYIEDYSPRWSPSGQQIAYSRNINGFVNGSPEVHIDVYKINADGTGDTRLTTGVYADNPIWSPDGTKIAYDVFNTGTGGSQIYIMNADGSNPHAVASSDSGYDEAAPVWSPDGSRIYFTSSGLNYYSSSNSFATQVSNTTDRHQVSSYGPDGAGGFGFGDYDNYRFDLSADGNTLAYAAGTGTGPGCGELWTISSSGGTPTQKTFSDSGSTCTAENASPAFVDNAWPTASTKTLVALGDSVAAGEGINYGYVWDGDSWERTGPADPDWSTTTPATDSDYEVCHQSGKGYPNLFALNGDYRVYNMACTGASAGIGIMDPKLDKEDPDDSSTTDVTAQLDYASGNKFDAHDADVVTLTVGANDLRFGHWMDVCYDPSNGACNTTANTSELNISLSAEQTNLRTVLSEINTRATTANKTLRVMVTNYYDPFPSDGSGCVDVDGGPLLTTYPTIGINGSEKAWLQNALIDMNANIADEVAHANSNFSHLDVGLVDISNVMSQHEYCTADPWVYGTSIDFPIVDGSLLSNDNPAPFHPTPAGQRAIYGAVKAALGGTTTAIGPSADAYVDSAHTSTNYGSTNPLWATSSGTRAFLRFNTNGAVPSGTVIAGATLKVYVTNNSASSGGFEVHPEDDSWTGGGVTWNTQPTWNSAVLATSGTASSGTWVSITLPANAINTAGNTSLGLRYTASGSNAQFASQEDTAHDPQLTIDYAPQLDASSDTYIDSAHTNSNYGSTNPLWATSSGTRTFLRFNTNGSIPSGSTLTSAFLRIYVTNNSVTTGGFEVHPEDGSWAESSTTWSNQPTWNSTVLATSNTPTSGSWVTVSLPTSAISTNSNTSFALRYTVSGANAQLASREDSARKPQLILAWQ